MKANEDGAAFKIGLFVTTSAREAVIGGPESGVNVTNAVALPCTLVGSREIVILQ